MLRKAFFMLMLLLTSGSIFAQKKESRLVGEIGVLGQWNIQGNRSSHLPLKYQEAYPSFHPSVYGQMLYVYKKGEGIGLDVAVHEMEKFMDKLNANSHVNQNYFGITWAKTKPISSHLYLKGGLSLGYVYAQSKLLPEGNATDQEYTAHGFGSSVRLTLAYKLSYASAIGLQIGFSSYETGRWSGLQDSQSVYNSRLFGKESCRSFYPTIGIVLTTPF